MKIISLSLSIIQADNRVIRQCNALSKTGCDVVAFGLAGRDIRQSDFNFKIRSIDLSRYVNPGAPPPETTTETASAAPVHLPPPASFKDRLRWVRRTIIQRLQERQMYRMVKVLRISSRLVFNGLMLLVRIRSVFRYLNCSLANIFTGYSPKAWEKIYWRGPVFNTFLAEVEKEGLSDVKLIVANDWQMLPIAKRLAEKYNTKYAYDSHEHALSENNHSLIHKYLMRGYLYQLESSCLQGASLVTSVSQGILDALKTQYKLNYLDFVVRSTPYYHQVSYRPVDPNKIVVYFHGYLKENRHLETILKALPYLGKNYHLLFRGGHYSSSDFEQVLLSLAKSLGVADRFSIVPLAMHGDMIELAKDADIGLSLPPLNSLHSDMALPNKFFEYVMAGLAIGVSDVKEMGDYVKKYDLGFVVKDLDPQKIAETISAFSVDDLNRFRRNSLQAAKDLNWESEQNRFVGSLKTILEI